MESKEKRHGVNSISEFSESADHSNHIDAMLEDKEGDISFFGP